MGVWKKLAQKDGKLLLCGKKLAIEPCYREIPGETYTLYRRAVDGLPVPKYKEVKSKGYEWHSYKYGVACGVACTSYVSFVKVEKLLPDRNSTEWYTRRSYTQSAIRLTYQVAMNYVDEYDTSDAIWIDEWTKQEVHYGWLGSASEYAKTLNLKNTKDASLSEIGSAVIFHKEDDGTLTMIEEEGKGYFGLSEMTLAPPPIESKTETIKRYEPVYDD